VAAAGVLPPELRHAGCGLISLPRLSAYDHDDVTVVSLRGELDLSGTAVLHAQLRDIRWRARSVAGLTGLPFPGCASLSVPARRRKPIRERAGNLALGGPLAAAVRPVLPVIGLLTWSRRTTAPGTPPLALGRPGQPFFLRPPSSPRSPLAAHQRRQVRYRSWAP
jgi:anti-anti-sigma factor